MTFAGVESEALLVNLDAAGIYAAAGSSCSSGATEPSHVLAAMGLARAGRARVGPLQPRVRVDVNTTSPPRSISCPRVVAQLRQVPDAA